MRISHKHKFVFISKPRCASTTIRAILDPYSDISSSSKPPYHHHATALELKKHFDEMGWNWKDYFVFTTVRNPWEMMVSYFKFFKPDINGVYNFEQERDGHIYNPYNIMSFNDWIDKGKSKHRLIYTKGVFQKNIWVDGFSKLTLANTINDIDNKSLANCILRIEDITESLPEVLNRLGVNRNINIARLNKSNHLNYRHYYTSYSEKKIRKEFISDIECGRYTF